MYLLLAATYLCIDCEMLPLIHASNINNISLSGNNSNFNFVFFKHASHAKPGSATKYAGSSRYMSRHIFLKFSNISASCRVSV